MAQIHSGQLVSQRQTRSRGRRAVLKTGRVGPPQGDWGTMRGAEAESLAIDEAARGLAGGREVRFGPSAGRDQVGHGRGDSATLALMRISAHGAAGVGTYGHGPCQGLAARGLRGEWLVSARGCPVVASAGRIGGVDIDRVGRLGSGFNPRLRSSRAKYGTRMSARHRARESVVHGPSSGLSPGGGRARRRRLEERGSACAGDHEGQCPSAVGSDPGSP